MLAKSKKAKGKRLENFVSKRLDKIFVYSYRRADSGSGKFHKEDVTLPSNIPIFIECKKHAKENIKGWWKQTIEGCPVSKMPVLVYELDRWREPMVLCRFSDILWLLSGGSRVKMPLHIHMNWYEFEQLLWDKYKPEERKNVLKLSKKSPVKY